MKKALLYFIFAVFLIGCNMNPSKEERIQKLETELEEYQEKISTLEKKIESKPTTNNNTMDLGAFSVSLSVKDINVSKEFYEKFGFVQIGGALDRNYLIMKNDNAVIGLFQGMFEGNILTFNPGWNESGEETETFTDIRKIQQELKNEGMNIGTEIDTNTTGPASFTITDPDGNLILIDQHR